jgi:phosphatidate cytidylyltransferase
LAAAELGGLARRTGADVPASWLAAAASSAAVAIAISGTPLARDAGLAAAVLLAIVVAAGAMTLGSTPAGPLALGRPAAMMLAATYIGAPLGAAAWVRVAWGSDTLTWFLAVIAVSDSMQFYTGRWLGRRKLAPVVSPGKTVEGAVGGLLFAALAGALLSNLWLPEVTPVAAGAVAILLAWFGIAGDLFQSLLKRSAGAKDSGMLIPGHGGVLDRVDAYLFAGPVFYLFLRFLA